VVRLDPEQVGVRAEATGHRVREHQPITELGSGPDDQLD
jgi:hypothetical protein